MTCLLFSAERFQWAGYRLVSIDLSTFLPSFGLGHRHASLFPLVLTPCTSTNPHCRPRQQNRPITLRPLLCIPPTRHRIEDATTFRGGRFPNPSRRSKRSYFISAYVSLYVQAFTQKINDVPQIAPLRIMSLSHFNWPPPSLMHWASSTIRSILTSTHSTRSITLTSPSTNFPWRFLQTSYIAHSRVRGLASGL